jgi:hypothetical protein
MKKKILIILLIALLAGAGAALYLWNKPHRTADEKPFATLSANDLFVEFSTDENAAWTKYRDKVIQVTGTVEEIKQDASGNTDIVFTTDDILGKVVITLKQGATADSAEVGTQLEVKGICNGFLSDVLLNQGVIAKPEKK